MSANISILTPKVVAARRLRVGPKRVLRPLLVSLIYLASLFVLRWFTSSQPLPLIGPWHLPVGFALGVLLGYDFRYVPLVFAGQVIAALSTDSAWGAVPYELFVAAATTGTYVVSALAILTAIGDKRVDLM